MLLFNIIFFFLIFEVLILKKNKYIYFLNILFFMILSFIRWEVGTDWDGYYQTFISGTLDIVAVNEIGYRLINYFIYNLTQNYLILLWIFSTILYFCKYTTIYKYSSFPFFSLLIYFGQSKMDIYYVRQHIAIAVCMYITKYVIEKKNKVKFLIGILLASSIHASSFAFLITPILLKYIKNRKKIIYFILLSIVLLLLKNKILKFSIFLFDILDLDFISNKILRYVSIPLKEVSLLNIIIKSIPVIFILLKFEKFSLKLKKLSILYIVGIVFFILISKISSDLARISLFFYFFEGIVLSEFQLYIKNPILKKMYIFLIIGYSYLRFYQGINNYSENVFLPYKTIFNKLSEVNQ